MLLRKAIERCVLTLCALLSVAVVYGQNHGKGVDAKKAAKVKAGLVFHLSKLTQWPDGRFERTTTPITVGVLGSDLHGFADYFRAQSANFTVQRRGFVVRKLTVKVAEKGKDGLDEVLKKSIRECSILFVTSAETKRLPQILAAIGKSGVLTVGETKAFSSSGGMVSFVTHRGRVKIYVNMSSLKDGRIHTSSEFLRHAIIVEKK